MPSNARPASQAGETHQGPASAPVYRLPNETLAKILKLVKDFPDEDPSSRSYRVFTLIHVCRWWREVVLNDPHFWTRIHLARIQVAELFFKLSQTLNVGVMSDLLNVANIDQFLKTITPHEARISALKLHFDGSARRGQVEKVLSNLFSMPLKNLRHLDIDSPRDASYLGLLQVPFTPDRAHLQTLSLRCALIHHDSFIYRGLRRLFISIAMDKKKGSFNTRTTLLLLLECPELEDLVLLNMLNDDIDWSFDSQQSVQPLTVELSRLKRLCLIDQTYEMACLLSCLILPEFTRLSISTSLGDRLPEEDSSLRSRGLPLSGDNLACLSQISSLFLECDATSMSTYLEGRRDDISVLDLSVRWSHRTFQRALSDWLFLARSFLAASVRSFTILTTNTKVRPKDWSTLFQAFPSITSVTIPSRNIKTGSSIYEGFMQVIVAIGGSQAPNDPLIFPQLSELEVCGFRRDQSIYNALTRSLGSRAAKGAPRLKRLILKDVSVGCEEPKYDFSEYSEETIVGRDDIEGNEKKRVGDDSDSYAKEE
ncbi:hypothetical protein NLI96_g11677 [Meripilus lineatus]|uniref:F-box domain-containing protein n=1 Tax=Meripilus lineatus TaxID=2056292 RepID=A0AAD5URC4_9APHY|nr:hypothetical protein NLI96_g11677 [Physisporinus lineatus]